jgi:transcriptional regulator NrdR family protein
MNCPTCGGPTAIYCTKKEATKVTRYRKCLSCNYHKFATVEELVKEEIPDVVEEVNPVVAEKEPVATKEKRKKTERNLMAQALTDICHNLTRKMKGWFV